jgi:hypothetical protein
MGLLWTREHVHETWSHGARTPITLATGLKSAEATCHSLLEMASSPIFLTWW